MRTTCPSSRGLWIWLVAPAVIALASCASEIGTQTTGAGGTNGAAGTNGTAGTNGAAGTSGPAGTNGTAGTNGAAGTNGTAGTNGAAGTSGVAGGSGAAGAAGTSGGRGGTTGAAGASGGRGGTTGGAGTSGGRGGTTGAAGTLGAAGTTGAGGAGTQPYKGIASYNGCTDLAVLNLSWYYTWSASSGCTGNNAQFVPQIWGHSGENIAGEIAAAASKGYPYVLGFNEPNKTDQSNMTVAAAIALWPQLTANKALLIGSPATSADTAGQTWTTSFMSMVNADTTGALRVDFLAIHWYGWNAGSCDANAASFESYVKWAEAIPGNRPIWITEWGCLNQSAPSAASVQAFVTGAIAMLAKHPRVARYGWYLSRAGDNNRLVNDDGTLTGAGTAYAGAPSTK